jgi:phosphopantothenoylcysteine decarboxylase/phosphopantothenate--cysteine ligase
MLEPQVLAERLQQALDQPQLIDQHATIDQPGLGLAAPLKGCRVLITAGPTREAIDPVRYISNHSSGKMGYALATAARAAGADVRLISGPVALDCPAGVEREWVTTAEEMLAAATRAVDTGCDIFIATAAVADYRPAELAPEKLKKSNAEMTL